MRLSETCDDVGLKVAHIEVREKIFYYKNYEHVRNAVESVNPFTERMPEKLKQSFICDYIKLVKQLTENRYNNNNDDNVISRYKLLIAVLSK